MLSAQKGLERNLFSHFLKSSINRNAAHSHFAPCYNVDKIFKEIIKSLAEKENITGKLKSENSMLRVQKMICR